MSFKILFVGVFILLGCTMHKSSDLGAIIDSGVSIELAKMRASRISNIHYGLSLEIPVSIEDSIAASLSLRFDLSGIDYPVILDFKEHANHLLQIEVNGKPTEIVLRNEHILLPKELLQLKGNQVQIKFIAGERALNRKQELLYTLFVPERARTFMPCFDQPDLKGQFTLQLSVPSNWEAISNASIQTVIFGDDRKTIQFAESDIMSTYLFSFVTGKFQQVTKTIHGLTVNFYHRETDTARINQSIDSIFRWHQLSLEFLERYTQIPYPFQKFDCIAIPDFPFGGMEHVGAIDYEASTLFLDERATQQQYITRAHVIAHETAHMWFGNLVTMRWFDDVWTKEVFANFIADKIMAENMPVKDSNFRFFLDHYPAAYHVDRTEGTSPIRQDLKNLDKAGSLYGSIIYHKAPIVMRQLENVVGKDIFQKGIRQYLKRFSFKNADWLSLIEILNEVSGKSIAHWNDFWVMKAGRPVFSYEVEHDGGMIKQLRIMQEGEFAEEDTGEQLFTVAFVYTDHIEVLPVNMNKREVLVKQAEGLAWPLFLLFNATGEGYGLFPVSSEMTDQYISLEDPLMRATACVNIFENILEGSTLSPLQLLKVYALNFKEEDEELILNLMAYQFRTIYWQFILPEVREGIGAELESCIWQAIDHTQDNAKKRILFGLYKNISVSQSSVEKLYRAWKSEKGPGGFSLNESDLTSLAALLVIRKHPNGKNILSTQLGRIENKDRKARFSYSFAALSNEVEVRDSLFDSFADQDNRLNEDWIIMALSYLHHPLRTTVSEKYLPKTLTLLEEIQATGSVFFPSKWLSASLGNYHTASAAEVVHAFLAQNPDYPDDLKRKILVASDDLFRAQGLLKTKP